MRAYKAFNKNLTCTKGRGTFQYKPDTVFEEDRAKCANAGFHCTSNPLDTLKYYPNMDQSVYWIVDAEGDINEDGVDSRISCTKMELVKELTIEEFVYESLLYMAKYPKREYSVEEKTLGNEWIAIARGKNPTAAGPDGCVLGLAKEKEDGTIGAVAIYVAGQDIEANTYCDIDGKKVSVDEEEGVIGNEADYTDESNDTKGEPAAALI